MALYRMVQTHFWRNPIVTEEMTNDDRQFYLYILTNPDTTQTGIYRITKKQMALDLDWSIDYLNSIMDRFILHFKVIRYNPETRELAIKNWGKYNLNKGGKPVMDCIYAELKKVVDTSLIQYVLEAIQKKEIRDLYASFCKQEERRFDNEISDEFENDTYLDTECEALDDTLTRRATIRGQKENKKENKKEKQTPKQKVLDPVVVVENHIDLENSTVYQLEMEDVKEIIEFWDNNGFGLSNINAKQQLLSWLDHSNFLQPKQVIVKAMTIACANNKRKLNYVVGILKNWENESLLTIEEIDTYHETQRALPKQRKSTKADACGRDIPTEFELDLTAGEDE